MIISPDLQATLSRLTIEVVRFAMGKGFNLVDAEDIAQEVVFRGWKAFDQGRVDPAGLGGYVNKVAENRVKREWAKRKRRQEILPTEPLTEESAVTTNPFLALDKKLWLEWLLGQLAPIDAEILRLKYVEHQDFSHIARTLGITEGNARVRASRARERLFMILEGRRENV